MRTRQSRTSRRWAAVIGVATVVAACSGGGSDDAGPADSEPPISLAVDDELVEDPPDELSADTSTSTSTTSTASTTTTTTEPPPVILPAGAVWQTSDIGDVAGTGLFQRSIVALGDEAWIIGGRGTAPIVWRSTDGVEWTQTIVQPPPADGALNLSGIVRRGDGYLGWGSRATSCQTSIDLGDGFRAVGLCERFDAVIYLSDDGAEWRRIEPPVMQVGGNESIIVDDVTEVAGGFVAIGTVRRPDWHARVWFSPDGENWDAVTELRGVDGPMSGHEVHWDGTDLVVMTHEHPCSQNSISFNTPGWFLGSTWGRHLRMWSGPDVNSLTPIASDDHPILEPPLPVDCSVTSGEEVSSEPYPDATGQVIGGRVTLLDLSPSPEVESTDDDSEPLADPYRLATLTESGWESSVTDGLDKGNDTLIEFDGAPAFVRTSGAGQARVLLGLATPSDDGAWTLDTGIQPIVANRISSAIGFGGAVLALGARILDPLSNIAGPDRPNTYVVARSVETRDDEVDRCTPTPGERCELAFFDRLPGYPDFSGADFTSAILPFADLSDGDFTDASFVGATLVLGESGSDAVFRGADFTGADLRGADLRDVAGADFTGADLEDARLRFSDLPASLEGANLIGVELNVVSGPDGDDRTVTLSLPGADLTGADIEGPIGDGEVRLIIEDLTGAILDGVTFYAVDLSGAIFDDGVDFADITVWDNSLCPDGLPPTGGVIGTCLRE